MRRKRKMEIIDKYVYAVTSRLPEKQRADIERELRGLIEDMLEDAGQGEQPTKQDVEVVLTELGNPRELATKYRGEQQYLISPELFPYYISVMKIVLASIAIGLTAVFCIETVFEPTGVGDHFGGMIGNIMSALVQGFAWVTIAFAIIEYTGAKKDVVKHKTGWKVSDLPELPSYKLRIKRSDAIASIVFSILFVMLITFSLEYFGIWLTKDGNLSEDVNLISFFNQDVFKDYLPYILVLFALSILNDCLQLITGKWTMKLLTYDIALHVLSFLLIVFMFSNSEIWNANFIDQVEAIGWYSEQNDDFSSGVVNIWNAAQQYTIAIAALVMLGSVANALYKMWKLKRG